MPRSLRRRVILGAIASGMFASTVGCQSGRLSAAKFAENFIRAKVDKERLIGETCAAFVKHDDQPANVALRRDLLAAKQHDLNVLARAVCQGEGCSVDLADMTIHMSTNPKPNALLRVVLREIDKQAKSGENLEKAAARLLADSKAMGQILFKMNVARAGVFVALKLGDATQNLSDKLADSFGVASGFARPVLEAVTGEIVAATMDQTFALVESGFHVPRANFTEEACAIYRRSEPRSNVAAFILERAILRYAPKEKLDALIRQGISVDCANLNEWIPGAPLDESVCERIRLSLDTKTTTATIQPGKPPPTPEEALHRLVEPTPPAPDAADVETYVQMEAEALQKSADACAEAYPNDREGACTLDRVIPVASDVYARAIANQTSIATDSLQFDDMEQRLAAIENELVRTTERLMSDEQRMQKHEADQKSLRELVELQQQRMSRLEVDFAQRERLVNTVLAQDEALRKLSGQMAELAVAAFREKCKKPHDDAYEARMRFAQNLGFPQNVCAQPQSLVPITANGMQIQPATFCRADLPMTIDFTFRFDAQIQNGAVKECDAKVRCNDAHYQGLCTAMRSIANELLPPDFSPAGETNRPPYRFIGHASMLPVQACETTSQEGVVEMGRMGIVGLGRDSFQNGLSYVRAKSVAEEFGKLATNKTSTFDSGKHFDLVAAGTTHVTGIGNTAKPSEHETFQREFQRVSMEVHARRFVFTVHDCMDIR